MKWFPLFFLMFFMSCEEKIPQYKKEKAQVAEETQNSAIRSKVMIHMDPRIKIDTDRQEIEITGQSGDLCGIGFREGDILRYQLLNDNELELTFQNETLKLNRIHHSFKEGIYGDWQSINFTEDNSTHRERIVTFIIRDHEVMEVDVYCSQENGKLFQEEFE